MSHMLQQTDLAGKPFLWLANSIGTSCWLPHGLPAPTYWTVSSECWRRSCFNELQCFNLLQLTAPLRNNSGLWRGAIAKLITLTLSEKQYSSVVIPGNHDSIICAEPCWWADQAAVVAGTHLLDAGSQKFITCHTTRQHLLHDYRIISFCSLFLLKTVILIMYMFICLIM